MVLALVCATEQQSYCRHAGVRRPPARPSSIKPVFSEAVHSLMPNLVERYFFTISPDFVVVVVVLVLVVVFAFKILHV